MNIIEKKYYNIYIIFRIKKKVVVILFLIFEYFKI